MLENPKKIGLIPDGNRRWSLGRTLISRLDGHKHGYKKLKEFSLWCVEAKVSSLTVFGFSTENWKRPEIEKIYLMNLLREVMKDTDEFNRQGTRVKIIGQKEKFPKDIQNLMASVEKSTAENKKLLLQIALSYGGRADITQAAKKIAQQVKSGNLDVEEINEEVVERNLWPEKNSDIDLLIRTGDERRVSNFLLWQLHYAEIYFSPKLWPDFTKADFLDAIEQFRSRERRLGK